MSSIQCFRVTIPDLASTVTIPTLGNPLVPKKIAIRNVGSGLFANAFRFNFPGDASNQYVELAAGAAYPFIIGGILGGEVMNVDGVGGSATAEVLIWEEQ